MSLIGGRDRQSLLVTGRYSDGNVRDLTRAARLASGDPAVAAVRGNQVLPTGEGSTRITARVPRVAPVSVPVTVRNAAAERPVSFRDDVVPALTRVGCNMGACHGTPTGKSGFRLSLQGYAPEFDYAQLALQGDGRRANRVDPGSSLILLKPMAKLPHGGGRRLTEDLPEFEVLTRWIREGLRDDPPKRPSLDKLEVLPGQRLLLDPARRQQLVATATFSDGMRRDVTHLVKFTSSDDGIATVSRDGLVRFLGRGEVAVQCRYQHLVQSVRLTFIQEVPGFAWPNPLAANAIDREVFRKLRLLRIPPSGLCSDAEFIRRVYLDAVGVLPAAEEVRTFLADRRPDRRARLIDRVLQRPDFADFWAMKWADVLRVNESTLREEGVRAYHSWIRAGIAADQPFDEMVRDLLTASGNPLENAPANFYLAVDDPENWMEVTSQLFMGIRIQCARCHNHPFERWTQDEYYALAAFFGQVRVRRIDRRERLVNLDLNGQVVQPRTGRVMRPRLLEGPSPVIPANTDRRRHLAKWLTAPENPFFARALANRVWFHLLGRGVVEPVDDFRETNPPVSDGLMRVLAGELLRSGFRLRPFVRFVMNSHTYQLSARPNRLNAEDRIYFSHAFTRMLTAEQLLDSISAVTGVPERFEGFPAGTRAAQLPGSKVSSPFLKSFGRPDRNLSCECERERESNLFQALQMISGRTLHNKLRADEGRIATLARSPAPADKIIEELYLAALTRPPTARERSAMTRHLSAARTPEEKRAALEDVGWVLINSKEFLFRH